MRLRIPDWIIYGGLLAIILANALGRSNHEEAPSPPPELGPALPNIRPSDPRVLVEIGDPSSGIGTAFAIDNNGTWLTARHVVDACDQVGLRLENASFVRVKVLDISQDADIAILKSDWKRPSLAQDFNTVRQIGERSFFLGFPQGNPGEAAGKLIGRRRMVIRGRYKTSEPILAWVEIGRTRGLKGSLGGLSGGPAFDADGEVIGLVTAESPRRGRIYTVSPQTLSKAVGSPSRAAKADAITMGNYGARADKYRRTRRIAQVACIVN